MKVVILAGGIGSRFSEETLTIPKPMIDIGGKPMLFHILLGVSGSLGPNFRKSQLFP